MFASRAGVAGQFLQPASVEFIAGGTRTTTTPDDNTWSNAPLGDYHPQRSLIIFGSFRIDTAPAPTVTLGGIAVPLAVTTPTSPGTGNPNAIWSVFTGAGSAYEGATAAHIVFSHASTIKHQCNSVARALNLANNTPVDTGISTADPGSINIDKYKEGIVVGGTYIGGGDPGGYTWGSTLPTEQPVDNTSQQNINGLLDSDADQVNYTVAWSPAHGLSQRGTTAASWRGLSNP